MQTENQIMRQIQHFMAIQPDVYVRRNNTGVALSAVGSRVVYGLGKGGPDLVGSVALPLFGRTIAQAIGVEVKSHSGRVSSDQLAWHRGAELMGWRICVARSVAEVEEFLASVRRGA